MMPTFSNLEGLDSVRTKINTAILQTEQNTVDIVNLDGDIGVAVSAAQTAANSAATSATNASDSAADSLTASQASASFATTANLRADAATTSATEAVVAASTASTASTAASNSASNSLTHSNNSSTAASSALTSATNAAAFATEASSSVDTAASYATVATTQAANTLSYANVATTQATSATTAANSASTSAASATVSAAAALISKNAASASVTSAATSATNASGSATTASTAATNAANSAAAALTSQNATATSASNAATSATTATDAAVDTAALVDNVRAVYSVITHPYFSANDGTKWTRFNGTNGALATQTISANPLYPSGQRIAFDCAADQQVGVRTESGDAQWIGVKGAFAYHITVDFEPTTGGISGAGIYLQYLGGSTQNAALSLSSMSLSRAVADGVRNQASGLVVMPSAFPGSFTSNNLYVMANYNVFGETLMAKNIAFDSCYIRPATDVEIAAGGVTRAEMVNMIARGYVPVPGLAYSLDGFRYAGLAGSSVISDLPGMSPIAPNHLEHWGVVTTKTLAVRTLAATVTTNNTAKVQEAMNATIGDLNITGWVRILDKITVPNTCRPNASNGAYYGGFVIGSNFNLGATAVVELGAGIAVGLGDLGMVFDQAAAITSGLRASLVAYPRAIAFDTTQRAKFGNILISGGIDGMSAIGNCGGIRFDGALELGCFGTDFAVDGALDFIHGNSAEVWPYLFADNANLMLIWNDGVGFAYDIGRADGWGFSTVSTHRKKVRLDRAVAQTGACAFGILQLDGDGANLQTISGNWQIGQLSCAGAADATAVLDISGGITEVGLIHHGGGATPVEIVMSGGELQLLGGQISTTSLSAACASVPAGKLVIRNTRFSWPNTAARTIGFILQSGTGILDIRDCWAAQQAFPSEVITVATNTAGTRVDGRGLEPHLITVPSSGTQAMFWTPRQTAQASVNFATPGNLSVAYGARTAYYTLDGNWLDFELNFVFTPTFTTASGAMIITVPGINALAVSSDISVSGYTGLDLTGTRESIMARRNADGTFGLVAFGDALTLDNVEADNCTTASQVQLFISGRFRLRA